MAAELIIAPEAMRDMAEAFRWYEDRRAGLGDEFLGCVDACLAKIARTPEAYAPIHETYRRALIRRFPYAVFYESTQEKVAVYAVFHTSRNPNKWRKRLP